MYRAATSVARALPARTLRPARPLVLLCPSPGSRTLSSSSTASQLASTSSLESNAALDHASASASVDALAASSFLRGRGRAPPDLGLDESALPPNVRFEGFEELREEIARGYRLHTVPSVGPIMHPLSSLASRTPTDAAMASLTQSPGGATSNNPLIPPYPDNIALPRELYALPLRRDILHRCVVWYLAGLRAGNQSTRTRSTVAYSGRKLRQQKGTGKARVGDASSGMRRGGAPLFALHPRDHSQLLPRKVRALGLATALSAKLSSGLLRIVSDLNEAEWSGTAEARRALCDETVRASVATPADVSASGSALTTDPTASEAITERVIESESAPESASAPASAPAELEVLRRFGTPSDLSILFLHAPAATQEDARRLARFERTVRNLVGVEVMPVDEVEVYHVLKHKWVVVERSAVEEQAQGEDGEALAGVEMSEEQLERAMERFQSQRERSAGGAGVAGAAAAGGLMGEHVPGTGIGQGKGEGEILPETLESEQEQEQETEEEEYEGEQEGREVEQEEEARI